MFSLEIHALANHFVSIRTVHCFLTTLYFKVRLFKIFLYWTVFNQQSSRKLYACSGKKSCYNMMHHAHRHHHCLTAKPWRWPQQTKALPPLGVDKLIEGGKLGHTINQHSSFFFPRDFSRYSSPQCLFRCKSLLLQPLLGTSIVFACQSFL